MWQRCLCQPVTHQNPFALQFVSRHFGVECDKDVAHVGIAIALRETDVASLVDALLKRFGEFQFYLMRRSTRIDTYYHSLSHNDFGVFQFGHDVIG